jgi:hypothetical protein
MDSGNFTGANSINISCAAGDPCNKWNIDAVQNISKLRTPPTPKNRNGTDYGDFYFSFSMEVSY